MTIPSQWAQRFNLQAGSEISLSERDNGLFVSATKTPESKSIEINIAGMDIPTIWKYFMGAYREGYDEIKIIYGDKEMDHPYKFFAQHKLDAKYGKSEVKVSAHEFFHELVERFIGMEIVDYGKDFIVVRELTEPTTKEFDNSLRRVFFLVRQMIEETEEAMKTGKVEGLRHIHDVDINLDKFHDYCIRIMNKIMNKDSRKTSLYFSTLYLLELAGDEFKNISHHMTQEFKKVDFKEILDIMASIRMQYDLYYSLFYKFEKEKTIQISELDKSRYFSVSAKKLKREETIEIFHHLRMIAKYVKALSELRIEMEF
jgi:phosphate uptake regulator